MINRMESRHHWLTLWDNAKVQYTARVSDYIMKKELGEIPKDPDEYGWAKTLPPHNGNGAGYQVGKKGSLLAEFAWPVEYACRVREGL